MSIQIVTSNKAILGNTTPLTLDVVLTGVQQDDCIVVGGGVDGNQTMSFADDKGNTYATPTAAQFSNTQRTALTYALRCAPGTTTITMTLSAQQRRAVYAAVLRRIRMDGSAVEDGPRGGSGTGNPAQFGPMLGGSSSGICLAVLGTVGSTTIAAGGVFTDLQTNIAAGGNSGGLAYAFTTLGFSNNANWTKSATTDHAIVAVVLSELADLSVALAEPVIGTSFF